MIGRKLKQLNYFRRDIAPRSTLLEGIEVAKKWQEQEFGKKVRISKVPIKFKDALADVESLMREHRYETLDDIKTLTSHLGLMMGNPKELDDLGPSELKNIENALIKVGFPTDWRQVFDKEELNKEEVMNRLSAVIGYSIRMAGYRGPDRPFRPPNSVGIRTSEKPILLYRSLGENLEEDYEFIPVRVDFLSRDQYPEGYDFNVQFRALHPENVYMDDRGDIFELTEEEMEELEEEGEEQIE